MKTFLKLAPLALAFSVSSSFAAEFIGLNLPSSIEPLPAFTAFVMSLIVLIAFTDYTRPGLAAVKSECGTWRQFERRADNALAA